MNKLVTLLNEYEKLNMCRKFDSFELHTFEDSKWLVDRILEDTVISRRYGFIKWLVENDKININEEWDDYEDTNLSCNSDFFQLQKHYSYYESLLMLLAIQDNPIEFLISILR